MPSFPGNDISTDKLPEKNPNKAQITKEIYEKKVLRWMGLWPTLSIVPW